MILKPKARVVARGRTDLPTIDVFLAEKAASRRQQTLTRTEDDPRLREGLIATLARKAKGLQ
jgi:hypothetical protein